MSNLNVNNITPQSGDNVSVSGSLIVSGSITANGNIILGDSTSDSVSLGAEISSSIIPDADNTYDLGSSGKEWKDLYVDGMAHIDSASIDVLTFNSNVSGSIIPNNLPGNPYVAKFDLGSSDYNWKDIYIEDVVYLNTLSSSLHYSAAISASGNFVPSQDDNYDLGSSRNQWKDLYVDGTANIDMLSLGAAAGGSNVSSSLVPNTDNDGYNLGSMSRAWQNVYAGTVISSTISASALPSSSAQATTNELYTLLGSQIFPSGSVGTEQRNKFNSISGSRFVLIK